MFKEKTIVSYIDVKMEEVIPQQGETACSKILLKGFLDTYPLFSLSILPTNNCQFQMMSQYITVIFYNSENTNKFKE